MQYDVQHRPAYALAIVTLAAGEKIQAEPGAMVSMSATVEIDTGVQGGFMAGLKRSLLGGEGFFMNTLSAPQGGQVTLAPALPGDITVLDLNNQSFMVQSGSYLASALTVEIDTKWGGAKTFFASEGLIMLKCSGAGPLILASYGAIHQVDIPAGQNYIIDSGHIVAFPEDMQFEVQKAGSWKSTILGGEGLVVNLTGPGTVLLQTRSEDAFMQWLLPKIPRDSASTNRGISLNLG
jgi:uncharacterized protein (TIGR00266 family)